MKRRVTRASSSKRNPKPVCGYCKIAGGKLFQDPVQIGQAIHKPCHEHRRAVESRVSNVRKRGTPSPHEICVWCRSRRTDKGQLIADFDDPNEFIHEGCIETRSNAVVRSGRSKPAVVKPWNVKQVRVPDFGVEGTSHGARMLSSVHQVGRPTWNDLSDYERRTLGPQAGSRRRSGRYVTLPGDLEPRDAPADFKRWNRVQGSIGSASRGDRGPKRNPDFATCEACGRPHHRHLAGCPNEPANTVPTCKHCGSLAPGHYLPCPMLDRPSDTSVDARRRRALRGGFSHGPSFDPYG